MVMNNDKSNCHLITTCYFDSELFGFFSDLFRFKFCSLGVNSIIDTMSLKKPNNRSSSDTEIDVLRNSSPQCFSSTQRTKNALCHSNHSTIHIKQWTSTVSRLNGSRHLKCTCVIV